MNNKSAKKKTVNPLKVILIGAGIIIGLVVLISIAAGAFKFEGKASIGNKPSEKSSSTETPKVVWETYTSEQYGYSVKIPQGWKVSDNSSENSRKITIIHPGAQAIVLITALYDERLADLTYLTNSLKEFKEKLEKDPATLQLAKFENKVEGSTGGFIAIGEERRSGVNWYFEERGLLSTSGRVLLFHEAAQSNVYKEYKSINSQITKSFKLE